MLLFPRDLGVNLELVAVFTEERNHLAGQRRTPATTEVVVAESIATAGARRERETCATMRAVEVGESTPTALQLVPDGDVERHLRDDIIEEFAFGLRVVVYDLVEIATQRDVEHRLRARIVLVIPIIDEVGRVLNVELHDGIPVVQNQLVAPVVLGEFHRLVHVLVGQEHAPVRLAVNVGLGSPARIRPVELGWVVLGAGDGLGLLAIDDTPHLDFLDPLLVIGDNMETVANAKRRTGDVTGIGRERPNCFFEREMRAQLGHVLRCRALDWELSENGTILLTFHDLPPVKEQITTMPSWRGHQLCQ